MYAVFETGGKQYRVTEGDVVFLEHLNGEQGDEVKFKNILLCSNEVDTDFGKPYLNNVSVEARILGHGKDKKIVIFKYKAKKGYRKKQGHRQPYTKVRVERIISDRFGVAEYVETTEPDDVSDVTAGAGDAAGMAGEADDVVDIIDDEDAVDIVDAEIVEVDIAEDDGDDIVIDAEIVDEDDADADEADEDGGADGSADADDEDTDE